MTAFDTPFRRSVASGTARWPRLDGLDASESVVRTTPRAPHRCGCPGDDPGAGKPRGRDFRLGRLAACDVLTAWEIDHGPIGRLPSGAPDWPEPVVGSISHADGAAIALLGHRRRWRAIGVDLESVDRWFPGLASEIATPREQAWLRALASAARRRAEIALFSAKEAYFKAVAPESYLGFDVVEMSPAAGGFDAIALESVGPGFGAGFEVSVLVRWSRGMVLSVVPVASDG